MKVRDLCTRTVRTCRPDTTLAEAGWIMWEGDCGILPVVDEGLKPVGVITDRDICMSVATKYRPAADIKANEVMNGKVHSCRLDDDVRHALELMGREGVRRLPVVDLEGRLRGVVSLNDVALAARPAGRARANGVTYEDLIPVLQAVCAHRDGTAKRGKPLLPAPNRTETSTAV